MTFIFKHFVSHYQMNRWLDSRQNIQQNFLGIVNRFYFTNFVYVFAASFIYVFKNVANLFVFNQLVYFVRNVSHILVLNYLNFIYLLLNHSHTHPISLLHFTLLQTIVKLYQYSLYLFVLYSLSFYHRTFRKI